VIEESADAMPDCGDGALVGFSQQRLELGEDHLDGIEVWTVGRQEQQVGAGRANGAPHGSTLVAAKVVEHDDIAGLQRGHQELLDPGKEQPPVDRSIDHAGRDDAAAPQSGQKGHGFPVAVRHGCDQALTTRGASMLAGHVGLRPGLVDEDQPLGIDVALVALPPHTLAGNVRPVLLGRAQAFF
jgi:hypothetical protein